MSGPSILTDSRLIVQAVDEPNEEPKRSEARSKGRRTSKQEGGGQRAARARTHLTPSVATRARQREVEEQRTRPAKADQLRQRAPQHGKETLHKRVDDAKRENQSLIHYSSVSALSILLSWLAGRPDSTCLGRIFSPAAPSRACGRVSCASGAGVCPASPFHFSFRACECECRQAGATGGVHLSGEHQRRTSERDQNRGARKRGALELRMKRRQSPPTDRNDDCRLERAALLRRCRWH